MDRDTLAHDVHALLRPLLERARIPGAGVAIITGGMRACLGIGFCDLEHRNPVTPDTLFPIASTTKALNAVLIGALVDEGLLAWDEPVRTYLPEFRLVDEHAAAHATLRDLIVMRAGLGGHDLVWMDNPIDRSELVSAAALLEPTAPFRSRFQYSNLTPAIAGHIAERVAGVAWEALTADRILSPLAMVSTVFTPPQSGDVTPGYHESRQRKLLVSRATDSAAIAPAGGTLYSSVRDMAVWLEWSIGANSSAPRILSSRTFALLQTPQQPTLNDSSAPTEGAHYGFGWFVDSYRGETRLSHTGWLNDVQCCMSVFPGSDIAVLSFVNFASARVCGRFNELIFDMLTGKDDARGIDTELSVYEQKIADLAARTPLPDAAFPGVADLYAHAGVYRHAAYGVIRIEVGDNQLMLRRGALALKLRYVGSGDWACAPHDHDEIHKVQLFDQHNPLKFRRDGSGHILGLELKVEPMLANACFVRD